MRGLPRLIPPFTPSCPASMSITCILLNHRDRGIGQLREADPRDIRGRNGVAALDEARTRAWPRDAGNCAQEPFHPRHHDGTNTGYISWDDGDKACYTLTLDLIEKASAYIQGKYTARGGDRTAFGGAKYASLSAERRRKALVAILPWLRGQVSAEKRLIGTVQDDEGILHFVNSKDAERLAELGTSCPDHFLRTKIKPLFVDWSHADPRMPAPPSSRNWVPDSLRTERTTPPTTSGANIPIPRPCAIPTPLSC